MIITTTNGLGIQKEDSIPLTDFKRLRVKNPPRSKNQSKTKLSPQGEKNPRVKETYQMLLLNLDIAQHV